MSSDDEQIRESLLGVDHSPTELRDYLDPAEYGVLGLTNDGEAYTIPLSFGYDAPVSTLYFLLAFEENSKKREFLRTTDVANFLVVETDLPDSWQSVVFTGSVSRVADDHSQDAYTALADTAVFPAPFTFDDGDNEAPIEQSLYEFDVETVSARRASQPADLDV